MSTYYPSCVAHLTIVFDESLTLEELPAATSVEDRLRAGGGGRAARPTLEPLITRRGASGASHILNRVPIDASIELGGYRQAGTFSLTLPFRDLPIDPRTVRSASVELHLGSIEAGEYGRAISRGERAVLTTRKNGAVDLDTLAIVGTVDNWRVADEVDGSTVTLDGRDLRGILLDTPVEAAKGVSASVLTLLDLNKPIDDVVRDILGFVPMFAQFTVRTITSEWPGGKPPIVAPPDSTPRHRRGARGDRTGASAAPAGGSSGLNFWDLIVNSCNRVGAVPYFEGTTLVVRPARSLFDQLGGARVPFKNGEKRAQDAISGAAISPGLTIRRMVYGRDVEAMELSRKFGGTARPRAVRVVSVNASAGTESDRVLEAIHPPESSTGSQAASAARTRVAASAQASEKEILTIEVPGLTSVEQLREVARAIYEEIGRGEILGSCTTRRLASFGGDNSDPDLLRLRPGDAVEIGVDTRALGKTNPLISAKVDHYRRPFAEQVEEIRSRIGDENLARVIVATARGSIAEVQRFFRTSTVRFDWAKDDGITIGFDFANYVVARNEFALPGDPTRSPERSDGASARRTP